MIHCINIVIFTPQYFSVKVISLIFIIELTFIVSLKIGFVYNYFVWSPFGGLTLLSCFVPLSAASASLWALINLPLCIWSAGRRPNSWSLAMRGQYLLLLFHSNASPIALHPGQQALSSTEDYPKACWTHMAMTFSPGFWWHHQGKPETTPAELDLQNLSHTGRNYLMRDDARFHLEYCGCLMSYFQDI